MAESPEKSGKTICIVFPDRDLPQTVRVSPPETFLFPPYDGSGLG